MDVFFGGQFSRYGADVLSVSEQPLEDRVDPMNRVFPKVTKCTFHKFGPSGTVEKFDGLCVLPLNIINEKIYVFLWFWFIIMSVVTGVQVVYRLITMFAGRLREILLKARARLAPIHEIESICRQSRLGDWFLLYQLGKNIDPLIFKEFVHELYKKYEEKDGGSSLT